MEQKNENITNEPKEKDETKKVKASAKKKPSFSEIVADHIAEYKKIIWPKPAETGKKTVMVVIVSLFIGGVIFCMDTVFTELQSLVIHLLS